MDLPMKLVDLVTLLFLSLMIVIIIFIILQRNIRRYKLRNIKDPHYHICKSIPRELKKNIAQKHARSNIYREPPHLFTREYWDQDKSDSKTVILRMKAFDTAKSLENALHLCGFTRPFGTPFEEFLIEIKVRNEQLPIEQLEKFLYYYKWILYDPQLFRVDDLRDMNCLINSFIEQLAINFDKDDIRTHMLELNSMGDFDLLDNLEKLRPIDDSKSSSNSKLNTNTNRNEASRDRLQRGNSSHSAHKNASENELNRKPSFFSPKKLLRSKAKQKQDSKICTDQNAKKENEPQPISPDVNYFADNSDDANRWSTINESFAKAGFNDDLENEEIPLVNNKEKKRSSHGKHSGKLNEGFSRNFESNF